MSRPVNATRADIVALLSDGHSNSRIARELRVDKHRVRRIREELGLPSYVPVEQTRTLEDKWRLYARPSDGGHLEWTGERVGAAGSPVLRYKDQAYSPAAIAFEMRHGRPAQGYAIAECGRARCVAPDHVDDEAGRQAKRREIRQASGRGALEGVCLYGHDRATHGRLERDGRPYCEACKRELKTEPEAHREVRTGAQAAMRQSIAVLLRQNIPQMQIAKQLGIAPATVQRTRQALGLPAPRAGRRDRYSSLEEAFHANTEPGDDGHLRWTCSTPSVCFRQQRVPAARVSFELYRGRPPVGPVTSACGVSGCVAGEHLTDQPMRAANKRADKVFGAIFGKAAA
ncbi:hypothetical protein DMH25_08300 [Streptomyces sp. WAC 01325]|uniref:helix-turn-helix domain-containing protein n=1 Tax=Streptomyces sp. WAC 01325 TaxID=2203202 RepID=UPI000F862104|nr:helix-turn-helix domain-containing protein [Streptomyces sp. WAC 01325]RSN13779.1 hypothetical protein DMH25_08300 [Streptomyces sp. WAC 01325]